MRYVRYSPTYRVAMATRAVIRHRAVKRARNVVVTRAVFGLWPRRKGRR